MLESSTTMAEPSELPGETRLAGLESLTARVPRHSAPFALNLPTKKAIYLVSILARDRACVTDKRVPVETLSCT